ncbi:interferon-induced protein with tetratricopeptide repeats 5-like [Lacerta agilis]|uniref:interferon-induced protein with tetratricopeptide repeats 5-like n=1 Tax=Lacerta agilis TaxID=80427 RepID=UPI0014198B87|nr:interferon-induced protein with tetratricopeptide repeats 5-like [Lacerta agilis]
MSRPLRSKLESLQCHFTWDFEIKDKVDALHILQTLAPQAQHTPHRNRGTYLAMRAYLQDFQGNYEEALDSLREAEGALKRDHPANFSRQALVTYGNYAWVYYHLINYDMVDLYLGRIHDICRSLASPEAYSAMIPEIHAQKGWSLLAGGFRNGDEAAECFRNALEAEASNEEFQAGLAVSAYASYTHSWAAEQREEAQKLLEEVVTRQPQNYEAKAYLARALEREDVERALCLADDVAQESVNPEVLRTISRLYKPQSLPRAISILKKAIVLDPGYHLPHHDLGMCYLTQLESSPGDVGGEVVEAAIESFKRSLEMDPFSIFSRLKLAKVYGERSPAYEEEIYLNLMEELPGASKRCQQSIYIHWGDFLLHKKGMRNQALEMYQAAARIPGDHALERKQLETRLKNLARIFKEGGEMDQARAVYSFLKETGLQVTSQRAGSRRRGSWRENGRAQQ